MTELEKIKGILESEVKILVEDFDTLENEFPTSYTISDNRIEALKANVATVTEKDDNFYTELIRTISKYLDKLYDGDISINYIDFINHNGETLTVAYNRELKKAIDFELREANQKLAENLFNYICEILANNQDIRLDVKILKSLLNRNPKRLRFTVEEDYICRFFDFRKLVDILNKNKTLKKSNISVDEIYQLLIDTCQLDNPDVFGTIITPEEFKSNRQKIDEILMWVNAKVFIAVTNIILSCFDSEFDRFSFIKNRNKNSFIEILIMEMLRVYCPKENYALIHRILTDENIIINYNMHFSDHIGESTLKELIAHSLDRLIITDLLSKKENIKRNYWHGDFRVPLYMLYATTGDYEKALATFNENYNYASDYTEDFDDDFNKVGYTYGDFNYQDSFVLFLSRIVDSFTEDKTPYPTIIEIINKILNSEEVKYINLEGIMSILINVLAEEDFNAILASILQKYHDGKIQFITVDKNDESYYKYYKIQLATEPEIEATIASLNSNLKKVRELKKNSEDESCTTSGK